VRLKRRLVSGETKRRYQRKKKLSARKKKRTIKNDVIEITNRILVSSITSYISKK
jgi:hypothetical protein